MCFYFGMDLQFLLPQKSNFTKKTSKTKNMNGMSFKYLCMFGCKFGRNIEVTLAVSFSWVEVFGNNYSANYAPFDKNYAPSNTNKQPPQM